MSRFNGYFNDGFEKNTNLTQDGFENLFRHNIISILSSHLRNKTIISLIPAVIRSLTQKNKVNYNQLAEYLLWQLVY